MPFSEDNFIDADPLLKNEDAIDALLEGRSSQTPAGYEHVAKLLESASSVEADLDETDYYMDFVEQMAATISASKPEPSRTQILKRVATRRSITVGAVTLAGVVSLISATVLPSPLTLVASKSSDITSTTLAPTVFVQNAASASSADTTGATEIAVEDIDAVEAPDTIDTTVPPVTTSAPKSYKSSTKVTTSPTTTPSKRPSGSGMTQPQATATTTSSTSTPTTTKPAKTTTTTTKTKSDGKQKSDKKKNKNKNK